MNRIQTLIIAIVLTISSLGFSDDFWKEVTVDDVRNRFKSSADANKRGFYENTPLMSASFSSADANVFKGSEPLDSEF